MEKRQDGSPTPAGTAGLKPTDGVTHGSCNQSAWSLGPLCPLPPHLDTLQSREKGQSSATQATLGWPGWSLLALNGKADQIHKDHNHSLAKPVAHTDKCGSQTAGVQGPAHRSPAMSPQAAPSQPQRVRVYTRDLVITVLPGAPGRLHITGRVLALVL